MIVVNWTDWIASDRSTQFLDEQGIGEFSMNASKKCFPTHIMAYHRNIFNRTLSLFYARLIVATWCIVSCCSLNDSVQKISRQGYFLNEERKWACLKAITDQQFFQGILFLNAETSSSDLHHPIFYFIWRRRISARRNMNFGG